MFILLGTAALFIVGFSAPASEYNPDGSHTCPDFVGYESEEAYFKTYGETQTMGTRVNMTNAMNNNDAVCLDGTVPVIYWRPGFGDGVNKFHVFFQGGGWCSGVETSLASCMDSCQHRATGSLGSSLSYTATANYDSGYMSTSQATNPLTYNWNTVYVKYCDGMSFSGNNMTTQPASGGYTLHWRGWRILNGVYELLMDQYNFKSTTDVLMSGCSAGGLTTWLHSDYVYDTYVKPLGANFLSMPDSGFFLEYEGAGDYISGLNWNYEWQNVSDAMNKECMADHSADDQHLCIFAQETAPYVHVRMFPLQSRYDSWQDGEELQSSNATLINEYGANMTILFESEYVNNAKYASNHAAFFDSCHHHCGEWDAIVIDGMKASQAQFNWYYQNNTHDRFWFQNDTYPCSTCC